MIELNVNGVKYVVDVAPDTPLLWVIREELKLTGTKFGCGLGVCGACTMHVNGAAMRSCVYPVSAAAGATITTIEGLGEGGLHALQQSWIDEQVPQCGYCQSGQIMQAAALLSKTPNPSETDISQWMTNICRCATYPRMLKAIKKAAASIGQELSDPSTPSNAGGE